MPVKKTNRWWLWLLPVIVLGATVYFLFFTVAGTRQLIGFAARHFVPAEEVRALEISGQLSELIVLDNLEFRDPDRLPPGTVVRIQTLKADPAFTSVIDSLLKIENGRVLLPVSEAILINGTYEKRQFDFNFICRVADVAELMAIALPGGDFPLIRGQIDDADITIRGTWDQPVLEGEAVVKHAQYDGIILSDIPVSFRIVLDREDDPLRISGPVDMTGGNIQTRRTKVVLENSKIAFEGDSRNPTLNIKGSAKVDKVNIRIAVTGTKETPEVNLTSTPSLPQEQLLVMLATGQRWQGVETALKQGQLSMDVTRDFVDYFFFGGTGSKLAEKYGIEEFNVTFEKDKKGFGIKKKITNGLKVDYAVEQMQQDTAQKTTEQSVGAEVNLTDNLSVDARKDLPVGPNDQPLTTAPAKDEIYLKYKKSF